MEALGGQTLEIVPPRVDPGASLQFQGEPPSHWLPADFDRLLVWGADLGMSDLLLRPGTAIWIRLHGRWAVVSRRPVSTDEILSLLDSMTRNVSSSAILKGGEDQDFAYEIQVDRFTRKRFRVNATACSDGWSVGGSLVLRTIPSIPVEISTLNLEPEILAAAFPNNGLVLVTGTMGSGKSTLLSSTLRHICETQPRFIQTYESPIEFDLTSIPNAKGPVVQTEIPTHLADFSRAPRNSARRATDVILFGESRDEETLRGMIEAAEIGATAYSTVHTRSVSETPARIINVFPADLQKQMASTLLSSLRLIVHQRLLPKVGGGRIALREFLVFDAGLRDTLFRAEIDNLIPVVQEMVEAHGQSLLRDAKSKLDQGLIEQEEYLKIVHEREVIHAMA